jgi:hypothetical protein
MAGEREVCNAGLGIVLDEAKIGGLRFGIHWQLRSDSGDLPYGRYTLHDGFWRIVQTAVVEGE